MKVSDVIQPLSVIRIMMSEGEPTAHSGFIRVPLNRINNGVNCPMALNPARTVTVSPFSSYVTWYDGFPFSPTTLDTTNTSWRPLSSQFQISSLSGQDLVSRISEILQEKQKRSTAENVGDYLTIIIHSAMIPTTINIPYHIWKSICTNYCFVTYEFLDPPTYTPFPKT